jgi:hypothetical protein
MTITIDGPDRKGAHKIVVYAGPGPGRKIPSRYVVVGEQDRHAVDFFARVRAALPARSS